MQIIGREPFLSNPDFPGSDRAARNLSTRMDFSEKIGNNTIW
jgi:hypothetical protein